LKKKDPQTTFLWFMSIAGKVCAETASDREKPSRPAKNRISYTTAARETISQLPTSTNFIALMPSCERLRLGALRVWRFGEDDDLLPESMRYEVLLEVS